MSVNKTILLACLFVFSSQVVNSQIDTINLKNLKTTIEHTFSTIKGKMPFVGLKKAIVKNLNIDINTNYNYIPQTNSWILPTTFLEKNIKVSFSMGNIPLEARVAGNSFFDNNQINNLSQLTKVNFDPAAYIESFKGKVMAEVSPESISSIVTNKITEIRKSYEASLAKEIEKIKGEYSNEFKTELTHSKISDLVNVSFSDINYLRNKIISPKELENYQNAIQQKQFYDNIESSKKNLDSALTKAKMQINKYESLTKIYEKIIATKKKYDDNLLVKDLQSQIPMSNGKFDEYLKGNSNLRKIILENYHLDFFQKLFLDISKLNVGKAPVNNVGSFSLQNLINNGINIESITSKFNLGLITGKNQNFGNLLQSGLNSNVTNEYSSMTGLKLGTGSASNSNQSVSVTMYQFEGSNGITNGILNNSTNNSQPLPKRSDAMITYNSEFPFFANSKLNIEVSKSLGSFSKNGNTNTKSNSFNTLLSESGSSNYAYSIKYAGKILNSDVDLLFNKVGFGYNNPGNYLIRRGEIQFGAGVSRQLIKRKLQMKYNINYRSQQFDISNNYTFKTINNKVQFYYRINKSSKLSLTYQRGDYIQKQLSGISANGTSNRLQIDGIYKIKLNKIAVTNNTLLSYQKMMLPTESATNFINSSLLFTHTSLFSLQKNLVSVTVTGNKSNNEDYLFNTSMFSSEINYSLMGSSKIQITSGIGYYDNSGWNKQLGVNEQLNTQLNDKLRIDFQIGYKKAIKVIKTDYADQFYTNVSFHYNLK